MNRTAIGTSLLVASLACGHLGRLPAPSSPLREQDDAGWVLARLSQREWVGQPPYTYFYERTGSGVQVFILDVGIDLDQPDLGNRVSCGVDILAGGGTADCTHGTFLAGLVGGERYGVAKKVRMTSVRVAPCGSQLEIDHFVKGLRWLLEHREPGRPGVVLVASNFPNSGDDGELLTRALADVVDAGFTVVVSAGNDGMDACKSPPANITRLLPDEALVVGATTIKDTADSTFTNYGPCVNLWAPGGRIYSDCPSLDGGPCGFYDRGGTSASAALVAGAAALYLERHPRARPAEVVKSLRARATQLEQPDGRILPLLYTLGVDRP